MDEKYPRENKDLERSVRLGLAFARLAPEKEENRKYLEGTNLRIFREPPYPHERAIVMAYVRLREKQMMRQEIDREDIQAVSTVLEWIEALDITRLDKTNPSGKRKKAPPLLTPLSKTFLNTQIVDIENRFSEFWGNEGETVLGYLKVHMDTLIEEKILSFPHTDWLDRRIMY